MFICFARFMSRLENAMSAWWLDMAAAEMVLYAFSSAWPRSKRTLAQALLTASMVLASFSSCPHP